MSSPAYRVNGAPASRETFYRSACDPAQSAVVEACAGAGKTWMLVSRILRALLEGARPHEILAITFTRKAAGEMQQRLNEWLREFADPRIEPTQLISELVLRGVVPARAAELAPDLAQMHERVLVAVRSVQAQTFHAWFANLLRAAPAELLDQIGLQRDMDLMEALDDHQAPVWRRFHAAVLRDDSLLEDFDALSARRGRSSLRTWLETALERRVEIELADRAGVLESSVLGAHRVWPELLPGEHPADALDRPAWQIVLRGLAVELGQGPSQGQAAAYALNIGLVATRGPALFEAAWAALFTRVGTPRKRLGDSDALREVQQGLERIQAQLRQHDAHQEHLRLVRLSRVLLQEYAAYKRARGLADMADLESCALALLRDSTLSGWVQERLDTRYRHVLIDEFQDTSPLQWHALHAWLSGYAGAGGGSSGQRAPSVFIVGDPKQSIYRFRRAEPRVFEAARHFVREALGGVVLECDHTRRNAPQILQPLNAVFGAAANAGEFGDYRVHSTEVSEVPVAGLWALPSVPRHVAEASPADGEAAWIWRDSLSSPRLLPEEERRAEEARHVAGAIQELVAAHKVRAGDIMVLCRKRQSLRLAAQALREFHLPFLAAEDHDLLDAPEVRDLVALLDVLASPGHNLSLAHALRSPLFGASDEDLIALATLAGAGADWWHALLGTPQDTPALQRARKLLQEWERAAAQLPPHDLLDRIVHQGQYRERVAAVVPADRRPAALDAIDALLEQSLSLDSARYATPYNFVRALKRRTIRVAARSHADAVQLLTIHGAKGLEARVVFVMDTDPQPAAARTANVLVNWPVDSPTPMRCAFVYSESRCPDSLREQVQFEIAAREREELNGLYVAMTRARERLIVSATQPSRGSAGRSWWARLVPHATSWDPGSNPVRGAARAIESTQLKSLPTLVAAKGVLAPCQTESEVQAEPPARRLGQAVHRFLEWAAAGSDAKEADALHSLARQAALEFTVASNEVLTIGTGILDSPECARFFAAGALRWAGNEVLVSDQGEVLRIDRLVQLAESGAVVWWVLDFKLSHAPDQLPAYRDQLLRYRDAVARLEPGALVRCAFITGAGSLIEIR